MPNFNYFETTTTAQQVLNFIKESLVSFTEYPKDASDPSVAVTNKWAVHSQEVHADTGYISNLVLKTVAKLGPEDAPVNKTMYFKLVNVGLVPRSVPYALNVADPTKKEHSTISVQFLDNLDTTTGEFRVKGPEVMYQFANESYTPTDRNEKKPVYAYINVTNERFAMVVVGDPAVNFMDYRKSFLYMGSISPFKYNSNDVDGNVLVTAGGCLGEPDLVKVATDVPDQYFGEYTSFGNDTFQMYKTYSGIEFQRHFPAFITQAPAKGKSYKDPVLGDTGIDLDKQGFQSSKWTGKYHLSPVYVVHAYEGYRGKLTDVIAVTKHNILHLDELIVDVEGKPWKQEVYKYFDINAEHQFTLMGANQDIGVALLKEVRY